MLFGGFLAWTVADRISLKRRILSDIPPLPASRFNDAIVVVLVLAIYVVFTLRLHQAWIGVPVVG